MCAVCLSDANLYDFNSIIASQGHHQDCRETGEVDLGYIIQHKVDLGYIIQQRVDLGYIIQHKVDLGYIRHKLDL